MTILAHGDWAHSSHRVAAHALSVNSVLLAYHYQCDLCLRRHAAAARHVFVFLYLQNYNSSTFCSSDPHFPFRPRPPHKLSMHIAEVSGDDIMIRANVDEAIAAGRFKCDLPKTCLWPLIGQSMTRLKRRGDGSPEEVCRHCSRFS